MDEVVVELSTALICFASSCFPALVGNDTPRGEFNLRQYSISTPGYGGDLLVFKHEKNAVFAIHRVFDVPSQQRIARLSSPHAEHRRGITGGCVNVDPEVYEKLVECCSTGSLRIK